MKLLPNSDTVVLPSKEEEYQQQPTITAGRKEEDLCLSSLSSLEANSMDSLGKQQQKQDKEPKHQPTTNKKEVSFSSVHVREYELIWNMQSGYATPRSGNAGPALSLSWKYQTVPTLDLDDYEQQRQRSRRSRQQLHLSSTVRLQRLVDLGYTRSKMEREMAQCQQRQEQERQSPSLSWKSLFSSTLRRRTKAATLRFQQTPATLHYSNSSSSSDSGSSSSSTL